MKLPEQNEEKFKTILIVLSIIAGVCLFFPLIIGVWWLYVITIPLGAVCVYLGYRLYFVWHEQTDAKKLCDCVTVKEICNIDKIAKELGWNNAKTRSVIDVCLKKGYLDGYFRVGEELRKKEENSDGDIPRVSVKKTAKKCSHCGGVSEYYEGEKAVCVYCGNVIEDDK